MKTAQTVHESVCHTLKTRRDVRMIMKLLRGLGDVDFSDGELMAAADKRKTTCVALEVLL